MVVAEAVGLSVWHIVLIFSTIMGGLASILWYAVRRNEANIKENRAALSKHGERLTKVETKVKSIEKDHEGFDKKFEKINEKMDTLLSRLADVQAWIKQGN